MVQGGVGARAPKIDGGDAARRQILALVVENRVEFGERARCMALHQIDPRERRAGLLDDVGGARPDERGQRGVALAAGRIPIAYFHARFANSQVRERDALDVAQGHGEFAALREFIDCRAVVAHQFQDRSANVARDRQTQGRFLRRIPSDHFVVQREGLGVIAHRAHDRGQRIGGQHPRLGERRRRGRAVRLRQARDRAIQVVHAVFEQALRDIQAGGRDGTCGLRRARVCDRLQRALDPVLVVDVLGVCREQIEAHGIAVPPQRARGPSAPPRGRRHRVRGGCSSAPKRRIATRSAGHRDCSRAARRSGGDPPAAPPRPNRPRTAPARPEYRARGSQDSPRGRAPK